MSGEDNVGFAFGITLAAGLCTTIGAASAFVAQLRNKKLLAGGLALSAGVMICKYLRVCAMIDQQLFGDVSCCVVLLSFALVSFADLGLLDTGLYIFMHLISDTNLFARGQMSVLLRSSPARPCRPSRHRLANRGTNLLRQRVSSLELSCA